MSNPSKAAMALAEAIRQEATDVDQDGDAVVVLPAAETIARLIDAKVQPLVDGLREISGKSLIDFQSSLLWTQWTRQRADDALIAWIQS